MLNNRGGQAAYAFFGDATLDVDENFQYALYQAAQGEVLPEIAPRITQIAPCSDTTPAGAGGVRADVRRDVRQEGVQAAAHRSEAVALMEVYSQGAMQSYAAAIALVVQAVIISPSFVYRTELGPPTLTADASREIPRHDADAP